MKTTTPTPTKWATLILGLIEAGSSQAEIARLADAPPSTIGSLVRGATKEPGHALGERLLELERKTKRKPARA